MEGGRFSGHLTEAEQNRLIVENMRLAKHVAQDFTDRGVDFEDLVAAGHEGLVKAAREFDPARGQFSTWAHSKISAEIWTHCRAQERQWKQDPIAEPAKGGLTVLTSPPPLDSDSIEKLYEWSSWRHRGNAEAIYEQWDELAATAQELREMYAEIAHKQLPLAELIQVQRKLIQCAFVDGRSIQQAAREVGVSYRRAVRLLKKALRSSF